MRRAILAALALPIGLVPTAERAVAANPKCGGEASSHHVVVVGLSCLRPGETAPGNDGMSEPAGFQGIRIRLEADCTPEPIEPGPIGEGTSGPMVSACTPNDCPEGQTSWRQFRVEPPPEIYLGLVCIGPGDDVPADARPLITPDLVLRAFREIPLPKHRSHTQPEGKTLVNFETIFYTDAQPLTRTLTLLGQRVRLEITPARFTWHYGDGTTATTRVPGDRYPAKTIVHKYDDAHATFRHHLTITWTADYAVNDGPLQPVPGTVTTTGPPTPLRIAEAVPTLIAPDSTR